MPLISVIIPVYNRPHCIERAVQSVIKQSFNDFELILVDDCSDQPVSEHPVMSSDDRIRVIRLEDRSGVSKARNTGVHHADSKWIAFLDSDDEWYRHKLQDQSAWFDTHSDFEIVQSKEVWIRNGVRVNAPKTHEKIQGDIFSESLDRCMITPSSVMMSRELFDRSGGFNESFEACEDYDLWLRICCKKKVGLIDSFLLTRYGGHSDQLSSVTGILDRFRIRSILQLIEHETLSDEQLHQAINVLVKKAQITALGYKKRGNDALYERYISIINKFSQ